MEFNSVDDILNFAIKEEENAALFYTDLASKMDRPWMSKIFRDFAEEERGHKKKLLAVREGKTLEPSKEKVMDLKIVDYMIDEEPASLAELDYQGALVIAMKKEKAAFKLYSDLAASTDNENLQNTFAALAQEEAKHKLRFEIEYDQNILTEN